MGISEPAKSCQAVLSELKSQMTNLGKEAVGHILAQQAGARGKEEVKVNPEEILEGKAACTQLMMLLFVACSFPSKCLLSSSLCNVLEGCGRAEELFEIDQVFGAPQQGFRGSVVGKGENILSTAVVRFQSEEEQRSYWAGVVLHGGCSFVGFWTNSDEF